MSLPISSLKSSIAINACEWSWTPGGMLLVSLYFRWDKKHILEFGLFYGVLTGFAGEGDHFGGGWEGWLKVKKNFVDGSAAK